MYYNNWNLSITRRVFYSALYFNYLNSSIRSILYDCIEICVLNISRCAKCQNDKTSIIKNYNICVSYRKIWNGYNKYR